MMDDEWMMMMSDDEEEEEVDVDVDVDVDIDGGDGWSGMITNDVVFMLILMDSGFR